MAASMNCWVCSTAGLQLLKEANLPEQLDSGAFRITDARYGSTGSLYGCRVCGFQQCPELDDVLKFYEEMNDEEYERTRSWRTLQARKILNTVAVHGAGNRLLDIGAGSGILVEEAAKMGYAAEGIEPSRWLWKKAVDRGLAVHHGVLPHAQIDSVFDIVCLIDVLEHVSNPLELLRDARAVMSEQGMGVVVTPDIDSLAARAFGMKWWHYRPAHIGYFNRQTVSRALVNAGFEPVVFYRPSWYFPLDYLLERVSTYLRMRLPKPLMVHARRVTVPLNLFDSLLVVFRKRTS